MHTYWKCSWVEASIGSMLWPLHAPRAPCAEAWPPLLLQEWNEIQYNGVYYDPPEKGRPGVIEENKSYVFKYPRPPK